MTQPDFSKMASLLDQLPAFYRENPGALEDLLQVAEELVSETRERLAHGLTGRRRAAGSEGSGTWCAFAGAADDLAEEVRRAAGTGLGLERWLRRSDAGLPPPTAIWHGIAARPVDNGESVEFRYTAGAAATLVWGEELSNVPASFSIPGRILPAGVPIQAVRLARVKSIRRPPDRARIPGLVFWDRWRQDGVQKPRTE